MTEPSTTTPPDMDSREKITPFIESAIFELVLLTFKQVTTPFAVLFCTKDFRDQIKAFHVSELNTRYSPTVARPLSFYVLWMAAHILFADTYWHYILRDSTLRITNIASLFPGLTKGGVVLQAIKFLSGLIGQVGALIVVAFAITLIIGVKSILVTLVARSIGCRIRFETALQASAYAMGTLLFFQYAVIFSDYSINAMLGNKALQPVGYYILIYGSLLMCMVLTVRVNQMIQVVDGTPETPTFVSWFIGTLIWLYLIILASGLEFGLTLDVTKFAEIIVNAFRPGTFDVDLN
jgi:hypothetical protein